MASCIRYLKLFVGLFSVILLYNFHSEFKTFKVTRKEAVAEDEDKNVSLSDEDVALRFERRYKQLHRSCHSNKNNTLVDLFEPNQNLLMSEKDGLEICAVPKSGSSSWHHLVWKLRKLDKGQHVVDAEYTSRDTTINQFSSYNIENKTKFVKWRHGVDDDFFTEPSQQNVFRIVLARHPFARLISAWNQKMLLSHKIWEGFFNSYPEMNEYNDYQKDPEHAISWEDFATYVSEIKTRNLLMNYHFKPAHKMCDHCKYLLSYVVKLEALDNEYKWLTRRLKLRVQLVHNGQPKTGSVVNDNPVKSIQLFMKRLPRDVIQRLYNLYEHDFINFGYTFDMKTFEVGGLT